MAGALTIIAASLGGAALGGLIGFGAQFLLEKRKAGKIKEGFINLLICDISSLLKLYNELIGEEIKKHNEEDIFHNYLRVRHNYFSVFDNNSDKILYLDDETSRSVVQLYNYAKAHIDTIYGYGEDYEDYCNLEFSVEKANHYGDIYAHMDLGTKKKNAETHLKGLFKLIKKRFCRTR